MGAPFPAALSFPWDFSSPEVLETKVEKCLEEVTRERGCAAIGAAAGAAVCVVVVVVVDVELELELARKRDWEWLEK